MISLTYAAVVAAAVWSTQGASAQQATVCMCEGGGDDACITVPIDGCVRFTAAETIALKVFKDTNSAFESYKLYAHVAARSGTPSLYDLKLYTNKNCKLNEDSDLFSAEVKGTTVLGADKECKPASYTVTKTQSQNSAFFGGPEISDSSMEKSAALSISTEIGCDEKTQHTCGDNTCIRLSWTCDKSPDCEDGSDEGGLCTTATTTSITTTSTATVTSSTTTTTTATELCCPAMTYRQTSTQCDCSKLDMDKFPAFKFLSEQPWVRTLSFAKNKFTELTTSSFPKVMKWLRTLDLSKNNIGAIAVNTFVKINEGKTMETLDLSGNAITLIRAGAFNGLACLKKLNLGANNIGGIDPTWWTTPIAEELVMTGGQRDSGNPSQCTADLGAYDDAGCPASVTCKCGSEFESEGDGCIDSTTTTTTTTSATTSTATTTTVATQCIRHNAELFSGDPAGAQCGSSELQRIPDQQGGGFCSCNYDCVDFTRSNGKSLCCPGFDVSCAATCMDETGDKQCDLRQAKIDEIKSRQSGRTERCYCEVGCRESGDCCPDFEEIFSQCCDEKMIEGCSTSTTTTTTTTTTITTTTTTTATTSTTIPTCSAQCGQPVGFFYAAIGQRCYCNGSPDSPNPCTKMVPGQVSDYPCCPDYEEVCVTVPKKNMPVCRADFDPCSEGDLLRGYNPLIQACGNCDAKKMVTIWDDRQEAVGFCLCESECEMADVSLNLDELDVSSREWWRAFDGKCCPEYENTCISTSPTTTATSSAGTTVSTTQTSTQTSTAISTQTTTQTSTASTTASTTATSTGTTTATTTLEWTTATSTPTSTGTTTPTTPSVLTPVEGSFYFGCDRPSELTLQKMIRTKLDDTSLTTADDICNPNCIELVYPGGYGNPGACGGVQVTIQAVSKQVAETITKNVDKIILEYPYKSGLFIEMYLAENVTTTPVTTPTSTPTSTATSTPTTPSSTSTTTTTTTTTQSTTTSTTTTTTSTTTTSTTSTATGTSGALTEPVETDEVTDYCREFTCGFYCRGNCGWDTDLKACITGGVTVEDEFTSGDCGGLGGDDDAAVGELDGDDDFVQLEESNMGASFQFDAKLIIIIAVGVAVIFLVVLSCVYCKQYNQAKQQQAAGPYGMQPTQYGMPSPQPQVYAGGNLNNSLSMSMGSPGSQSTRV